MPAKYPKEFRDDVVRVALNREPGVTLSQIAKDFGIHVGTFLQSSSYGPQERDRQRNSQC